jgi:tetratricopeptide (TPR) repeat protein
MAKSKRKGTLNAALKALLAGVETSPLIKIPATFISELASLPDEEQEALAELPQDQFNELLTQSELATINAADSAATGKEVKGLVQELLVKVDALVRAERGFPERVVHNLPYPSIGNLFKGRDDELEKLTSQLVGEKPIAITQAIEGLGGIGKTRLAIEFGWWVWENKKCQAVFFVSAETPERLRASLASLAAEKMLGVPGQKEDEQIASVTKWLMGNSRWLMILDNADTEDAANEVESFLPSLANGSVIITSRYRRWSGAVRPQQLGVLESQQAKQFLLERTAAHRIETDSDEEEAEKLAKELGYLPLALEQTAAYIANNKCSLAEYIEEWENERQQVLKWYDKRQMQYDVSVAVTWQRTFDQLKPSARILLRLAAFLAPEMIPTAMFQEGIEVLNKAAELQCKEMKVKKVKFKFKEALSELAAYSMITRQQKGFTVHRIVQEVIRSRISEADQQSWLEIALKIVNNFAPTESDDVRTWPIWDVLRPHAELISRTADLAKITEPTSRLMNVLGSYLYIKGLYHKAEQWMRRSLKIDEASFGADHPKVAILLNNLAQLLKATNRLDKAEPLMRRALKIDEASFDTDHPKVAIRLNNLAQLLQDTNRLDKAEPLMRRALKIDESSLGPDHPTVAIRLNNLAQLLEATNRLDKAEPLMRRALKIDESSFGPDHPNVAIDLNNLASLFVATNRLDKAEPLMRRALKIFEDSLGRDHPNTQAVRNNLKYLK